MCVLYGKSIELFLIITHKTVKQVGRVRKKFAKIRHAEAMHNSLLSPPLLTLQAC